jgi:glycosyltransferase involved in cell wall biosynthesis
VIILRESASPSFAKKLAPFPQTRHAYRVIRFLYPLADRVLTLTHGARDDLIANFFVPASKVTVMHSNAVLETDHADDSIDGERTPGLVVCVGRLSPEKDQETLIKAFALLPSTPPLYRLALAGDGPSRSALEALTRELGLTDRVQFLGNISDPFALLRTAEVAVCSSRYEGFGNAIVEALSCGTAVVSTDCPYGPREILNGGEFGDLVAVGDVAGMASAIEKALRSPVQRDILRNRAMLHTVECAAADFLNVVRDCFDNRQQAD